MACFLVDYENESGKLLEGVSLVGLDENDEIIIFYSKNASRVPMALHKELERTPAKKAYIMTEVGIPNALDFQLCSYLGACVHKNPEKEYYIVSKDIGFDCVCRFWRMYHIAVKQIRGFIHYQKQTEEYI